MNTGGVKGFTGRVLRVDLSQGSLATEVVAEGVLRQYLGGTGLGAWFLYREVPPGVGWEEPENRLILASGPLGGIRAGGSGCFSVVTKGPLTNGATSTQANGFFGAYLKFSGFDGVVLQGASPEWVYLYIHDGTAELRDARHLVGKDIGETEKAIKEELGKGERELSVFSIGPAGENQVKFAFIVGDGGHAASRNGVGAVMGAKRVKAVVAARGRARVPVAQEERVRTLAQELLGVIKKDPHGRLMYQWGHSVALAERAEGGNLAVRNLTTNLFSAPERYIRPHYKKVLALEPNPCWACRFHCHHMATVQEGPYAGYVGYEPSCFEHMAVWTTLIGQEDVGTAVMLHDLSYRLGLETNEGGYLIGLVMECFEKGILTREDTDGLEMTWGNAQAVAAMLGRIAHRQGFGDVLAEGVMRAAQRIGGDAPNLAVHYIKGNAPRAYDPRGRWTSLLDGAVANTATTETGPAQVKDNFSASEVAAALAHNKGRGPFMDSLVMCTIATDNLLGKYTPHMVEMLNAATGWDFTLDEALTVGVRVANLLRAFNLRHGITPAMDYPSPRLGSAPVDGPAQGKSALASWEEMLDIYYREMGWDRESGRPWSQTLEGLGLAHVIPDLWP
ncbi:MAG: hypothetical protein HYU86_11460 [Chloroflexi bacterium]|nr:hypothetical protein [Chloroflexota bacterium]